jgi:hypothetical protein
MSWPLVRQLWLIGTWSPLSRLIGVVSRRRRPHHRWPEGGLPCLVSTVAAAITDAIVSF